MKTLLPLLVLAGTAWSGTAQTNAPSASDAKPSPAPATVAATESPADKPTGSTPETVAPSVVSVPVSLESLPKIEPKPPLEGIEGRHADYTGAVPRAVKAGGFKGVLNLFNPFAPLSEREKRRAQTASHRPEPRGFVDDKDLEPEGIVLISVEQR